MKDNQLFYIKCFLCFLKQNGIYYKYFVNASILEKRYNFNDYIRSKNYLFERIKRPEQLIHYAFNWASTKEGYNFWFLNHEKWLTHLKKTIEKSGKEQIKTKKIRIIKDVGEQFKRNDYQTAN